MIFLFDQTFIAEFLDFISDNRPTIPLCVNLIFQQAIPLCEADAIIITQLSFVIYIIICNGILYYKIQCVSDTHIMCIIIIIYNVFEAYLNCVTKSFYAEKKTYFKKEFPVIMIFYGKHFFLLILLISCMKNGKAVF